MAKGIKTGGRVKGSQNKATLEKKLVEEEIKQRVLKNAQRLLDSQLALAQGCAFLYKITTNKKGERSKPVLIKDNWIIETYLNGDFDEVKEDYYYITTEKPSGQDIERLFDRTFGKPVDNIDVKSGGERIGLFDFTKRNDQQNRDNYSNQEDTEND